MHSGHAQPRGTSAAAGADAGPARLDHGSLRSRVSAIEWHHRIELGDVTTPGIVDCRAKLPRLHLPDSLEGMSVLDIGAWDGFYSFEAERRGARHVLAVDRWDVGGRDSKAGFDLAWEELGSGVQTLRSDLFQIDPGELGRFDLVLFLGVLYHVEHPVRALEILFELTGGLAIVETAVDALWSRRPAACYYAGDELHQDPTNWWGPNPQAVLAMMETVGFTDCRVVYRYSFPRRIARAVKRTVKRTDPFWRSLWQGRAVVHGRRPSAG